jgi:hypothetical protein
MTTLINAAIIETNNTLVEGVDINVRHIPLSVILHDMVDATRTAYGSHIRIAAKFNDLMPFAWFDMAPNEKSENAVILGKNKTELYKAFRDAGHTNPSVPFKRICDYGRNMANGLAPSGKVTLDGQPVEAGEGEGNGANPAPRSITLRYIEECAKLWKAADKHEGPLPAKVAAAQKHIEAALKALGLDVATIAK